MKSFVCIKCYMTSLVSLTVRLYNVCAQTCLLSVGHWLNLDPDAGLWVRVEYECVRREWG